VVLICPGRCLLTGTRLFEPCDEFLVSTMRFPDTGRGLGFTAAGSQMKGMLVSRSLKFFRDRSAVFGFV